MKSYTKYSGMAMEMFGLLLVLAFIGRKADQYFENERYYLTALFMVLGLISYFFRLYFQLTKNDKK